MNKIDRTVQRVMASAPRTGDRHRSPQLVIRAPAEELEAWREAAAEAGEGITEWLRHAAHMRISAKRRAER
jgi:hypothetical protein